MKRTLDDLCVRSALALLLLGACTLPLDQSSNPFGPFALFTATIVPGLILLGVGWYRVRYGPLPDPAICGFQQEILDLARTKLGRPLTETEERFVRSRGGFVALEMILDTVRAASPAELEKYLNSEG